MSREYDEIRQLPLYLSITDQESRLKEFTRTARDLNSMPPNMDPALRVEGFKLTMFCGPDTISLTDEPIQVEYDITEYLVHGDVPEPRNVMNPDELNDLEDGLLKFLQIPTTGYPGRIHCCYITPILRVEVDEEEQE